MQKWEYLELYVYDGEVQQANNRAVGLEPPRIHEYLNTLGEDGWELVSASPSREGTLVWLYYLKRRKVE